MVKAKPLPNPDPLAEAESKLNEIIPSRIRILADWLDKKDDKAGLYYQIDRTVQRDLRIYADNIEAAIALIRRARRGRG